VAVLAQGAEAAVRFPLTLVLGGKHSSNSGNL
jgi:hypothetical protein